MLDFSSRPAFKQEEEYYSLSNATYEAEAQHAFEKEHQYGLFLTSMMTNEHVRVLSNCPKLISFGNCNKMEKLSKFYLSTSTSLVKLLSI